MSNEYIMTICLIGIIIGSLLVLLAYFPSLIVLINKYAHNRNELNPNDTIIEPALPEVMGDRFRILSGKELIDCLNLNSYINSVKESLSLSDETWPIDALPFIHNYIEFVQRLPASENHHHAGDGGLIKHTLEVAHYALRAAKASSWPPQATTEDKNSKSTAWLYGIFIAAMLHDVGKTRSNYKITLFPEAESKKGFEWVSDIGTMSEAGAKYYTVGFHDQAAPHDLHGKIAWMYFLKLVRSSTRAWLAKQDPALIETLRDYLTTSKNDPKRDSIAFHKLIVLGDQKSTKEDLRFGSRQRFKTAIRPATNEILMQASRSIMADLHYYGLNVAVPESGGSVFRKGDYVFITSHTFIEAVYKYVKETHKGEYNLPTDPYRLMDTFLEYGMVIPTPVNPNRCVITIEHSCNKEGSKKKLNSLTTICFAHKLLYSDPSKVPAEYQGEFNVVINKKDIETVSTPTKPVKEEKVVTENKEDMAQKETEAEMAQASTDFLDAMINGSEETDSVDINSSDEAINNNSLPAESDEAEENITENHESSLVSLMLNKVVDVPDEIEVKTDSNEAENKVNDTTDKSNEAEDKKTTDQQKISKSDSNEAKEDKKVSGKTNDSLSSEKNNKNEPEDKTEPDRNLIEPQEKNNTEKETVEEQSKPTAEPAIKKLSQADRSKIIEQTNFWYFL